MVKKYNLMGNYDGAYKLAKEEGFTHFDTFNLANNYGTKLDKDYAEHYHETVNLTKADLILTSKDPVGDYAGYNHRQMNEYLRTKKDDSEDNGKSLEANIDKLRYIIAAAPFLGRNVIVYRHVTNEEISQIIEADIKGSEPYQDKGFTSTSLLRQSAEQHKTAGNNILKLYTPAYAKAIYLPLFSKRPEETELLFYPGSYLKLLKHPYNDGSYQIAECFLLPYQFSKLQEIYNAYHND